MAFNFRVCLMWCVVFAYVFYIGDGFVNGEDILNAPLIRHRRSYQSKNKTNQNLTQPDKDRSPVFATENCTVVFAQVGGTATLPCVVRKFSNGVVSWIRKHDYHLLTVGLATYNTDDRFLVEHVRHLQNWGLLIRNVQASDEGLYECQISTHPPTSIIIQLKVTKASASIQGSPDLYLRAGSVLRLVCTLQHSTEPPAYVFWYHEQRMINYDPGVEVKEGRASSVLQMQGADKSHNGNYTCSPSNAVPASIIVHVLNATAEEKPAAMQHANASPAVSSTLIQYGLLIIIMVSSHPIT